MAEPGLNDADSRPSPSTGRPLALLAVPLAIALGLLVVLAGAGSVLRWRQACSAVPP